MPTPSPDDQAPAHADAPRDEGLTEQQLEQVAGGAGPVIDCEGHAFLTSQVLGKKPAGAAIKQPE